MNLGGDNKNSKTMRIRTVPRTTKAVRPPMRAAQAYHLYLLITTPRLKARAYLSVAQSSSARTRWSSSSVSITRRRPSSIADRDAEEFRCLHSVTLWAIVSTKREDGDLVYNLPYAYDSLNRLVCAAEDRELIARTPQGRLRLIINYSPPDVFRSPYPDRKHST
jgi:hypothetical protein